MTHFQERLVATGDAVIAECARKDRIWDIGLGMDDPKRFFVSGWRYYTRWAECSMGDDGVMWFQVAARRLAEVTEWE